MDMWVVAAAAGAGYLAKHWQKLTKEKEDLIDSISGDSGGKSDSHPLLELLRDKKCSISRSNRRRLGNEGASLMGNSDAPEMPSTSGVEFDDGISLNYGNSKDWNVLSLTSLPPEFSGVRNGQESGDRTIKGSSDAGDICSVRSKSFPRRSVKGLSSLDSCLTAQMYKEHVQMEEYMFTPFPSPSRTVRPLFVTDGSRIISQPRSRSCREQFGNGEIKLCQEDGLYSDVILGVPPLPEVSHSELLEKPKQKKVKGSHRRLSRLSNTKVPSKQLQSKGLPNEIFVFSLGITLGVMSTILANKREVDKLNELLKQTENFVQDLQEELEMKDSLTVKELANEGCRSQQTADHIFPNLDPTSSGAPNVSSNYDFKRSEDHKSGANSDSMSRIEAELEAELERLEMNMKASNLERRLSGFVEVDPDFVADIVQGELRADMVNGGAGGQAVYDSNTNGTSTPQTQNVNYAVSPRELSLCLHEVIESRLEERIAELETALENSQRRMHMDVKQMSIPRNYSGIDIESSSQESPTMIGGSNIASGSFFLNLSGDALDAYSEACEEFLKNSSTDGEGKSFTAYTSNQIIKEVSHPSDHNSFGGRNRGTENGSLLHQNTEVFNSRDLVYNKVKTWEDSILTSQRSEEAGDTEDESDDEFGRLLIKEIVEKARKGSPVVLNAQRMLFSMDQEP